MEWFATWFDTSYYHILYKNRDNKEAEFFIRHLLDILNLDPQSKILDLACGKGRHSVFLNALGYSVHGMDLSEASIQYAKKHETHRLTFSVGDMRKPYFPNSFDTILNLFTSIGYFEDKQDNKKVFQSVSEQLKENGIFVIDYLNPIYITSNLKKYEEKEIEGIQFKITKEINDNFIVKNIHFIDKEKEFHFQEKVQLFHYYDFINMAEEVDLELVNIYGNYNLEDFDEKDSPRTIIIFKKNGK